MYMYICAYTTHTVTYNTYVTYADTEKCGLCYSEDAAHKGRGTGGEGDRRTDNHMIIQRRQGDKLTDTDACTHISIHIAKIYMYICTYMHVYTRTYIYAHTYIPHPTFEMFT